MGRLMTLKDLIEKLDKYPKDTPVCAYICKSELPPEQSTLVVSIFVTSRTEQ